MTDTGVISLPLPDAQARARIPEDLSTNLLVEAGAGSGKTTALVGRMVALITEGVATVDELAAVTFTRKAAGELRERFQMGLEERIAAATGGDDLAIERLMNALDGVDRAFIGTIHAFCARLLRERPLEVGLDPAFEEIPLEERARVRRDFWEAYLERLVRDADPVLERLSAAGLFPSRLWTLFDRLVENPDVSFPTDDVAPPDASELGDVRGELEELVDLGWELMPEHEPARGWDSLQRKIRTLHFTRDVTGWKTEADLFEALDTLCKPGPRGHSITQNRWKDGSMAKAFAQRTDAFSVGDTPARALLGRWFAHRYALAIELARGAAVAFAEHRKRTARLDFQDLLLLTAELLRRQPDVRSQLGHRYRRILVDEFQDTDPLQAELLLLLASEPGEGGGDSVADWRVAEPREGALFVVGDPKQSIYRFRRADIQLYAFVKERFGAFGDVVRLTTNFRSRPPVGDLVNELFPRSGFFPSEATPEQAAFEPLNTRPAEAAASEGVFWYAIDPQGKTRNAAAEDDAGRLATWIASRVAGGEREAGDFLILTRKRSGLEVYARALEAHGLPVQVTGAGVGVELELQELQVLIECMIDPTNPVKVLAALVGLFFGLDYEQLVEHRLSGGDFEVIRPTGRGHPDVEAALEVISGWWRWASAEPADVFVGRLVTELGLLPFAAAGELGTLRAGALVYALDAVHAAALNGDASLPGALAALRAALELPEAEAPLEPGRPDVVRLMNLHQAKGLEAEVVILADPTGAGRQRPDLHMSRGQDGEAVGFLRVTEGREGWGGDQILALPRGWAEKEAIEQRFDDAEEVRLLYVAVTRAKRELVVSRWPQRPDWSPWHALDAWLDERAEELRIEARVPSPPPELELTPEAAAEATDSAARRLAASGLPSFVHRSVTDLAKATVESGPPAHRAAATGAQAFRGFSWGSAVHGALAAAAEGASPDALRATCRDLLVEHRRPLDDHGDPVELDELLEVVESVRVSDLWTRAHASEQVLAEVPFASELPRDESDRADVEASEPSDEPPAPGAQKQLDLFGAGRARPGPEDDSEAAGDGSADRAAVDGAVVLEGVIDLAFKEKGGWVIADYKTDVGTDPDFAMRVEAYRRQVELYADAWTRLTGERVKERVLFFTAQGRVESW